MEHVEWFCGVLSWCPFCGFEVSVVAFDSCACICITVSVGLALVAEAPVASLQDHHLCPLVHLMGMVILSLAIAVVAPVVVEVRVRNISEVLDQGREMPPSSFFSSGVVAL